VRPRDEGTSAENLAPTGIRSPNRPARSEFLYRLSYQGPTSTSKLLFKNERHRTALRCVSETQTSKFGRDSVPRRTCPCPLICCRLSIDELQFVRSSVSFHLNPIYINFPLKRILPSFPSRTPRQKHAGRRTA
jgi:hypothetical protein